MLSSFRLMENCDASSEKSAGVVHDDASIIVVQAIKISKLRSYTLVGVDMLVKILYYWVR